MKDAAALSPSQVLEVAPGADGSAVTDVFLDDGAQHDALRNCATGHECCEDWHRSCFLGLVQAFAWLEVSCIDESLVSPSLRPRDWPPPV